MLSLMAGLADLTSCRDRDQTDAMLAGMLVQLLQPHSLALHRVWGELPRARWITCALRTSPGQPLRRSCASEQLPLLESRPDWLACISQGQPLQRPGTPALTLFPLWVGEQATGVLEVQADGLPGQEQTQLVQAALKLYGNFLALLDYGERDALTGLLNRKTFDVAVMRAYREQPLMGMLHEDARSTMALRPWLAVVDVDHFKRVNDSFGHLIGDEVLLLLAGIMRSCFRLGDRLFRFGGEEFVVLLAAPDEASAKVALQRLRTMVERFAFPQVGRVTISIGLAALHEADTPADAVRRADRALYHAKANGRNRVVGPQEMTSAGIPEQAVRYGAVDLF